MLWAPAMIECRKALRARTAGPASGCRPGENAYVKSGWPTNAMKDS